MKVSPWWVTGVVDAEGCFYTSLRYRTGTQCNRSKTGRNYDFWDFSARLTVNIMSGDASIVRKLKSFFGVGKVTSGVAPYTYKGKTELKAYARYQVSSLKDLQEAILPHFEMFPLQTKKSTDFSIWRDTVRYYGEEFYGRKGVFATCPDKRAKLSDLVSVLRSQREYSGVAVDDDGLLPDCLDIGWWVTGFTDGDGSFSAELDLRERDGYKAIDFSPAYGFCLRADDAGVLYKLQRYFGVGDCSLHNRTYSRNPNPRYNYRVRCHQDCLEDIVTHFREFPPQGKKQKDLDLFEFIIMRYFKLKALGRGWWQKFPAEYENFRKDVMLLRNHS